MSRNQKITFAIVLLSVGILGRLLPHAPNIAPIGALAIMGSLFVSRRFGWALPLVALFVSDAFIGFYSGGVMVSVYGSFILIALLNNFSRRTDALFLAIRSVSGSIFFFLTTNFAVWLFGTMYPHTISGLVACFIAAIPFFRNTFMGDIIYVFSLAVLAHVFTLQVNWYRKIA